MTEPTKVHEIIEGINGLKDVECASIYDDHGEGEFTITLVVSNEAYKDYCEYHKRLADEE